MNDDGLVDRARSGDQEALTALLDSLRGPLHRLATAMLWSVEDAEDATQDALIEVVRSLHGFRGDAAVSTWAHRIAVRIILRRRQSAVERQNLTFDGFAADLLNGLSTSSPGPDHELLAEEVRIGCTLAVLQCLDRHERLVFILGDVLGLSGRNASAVLNLDHAAYRKQLSRVRAQVRNAVTAHCGLINDDALCRCDRRIQIAIDTGRLDRRNLRFVGPAPDEQTRLRTARHEIEHLYDIAALFRSAGNFAEPDQLRTLVRDVIEKHAKVTLDEN